MEHPSWQHGALPRDLRGHRAGRSHRLAVPHQGDTRTQTRHHALQSIQFFTQLVLIVVSITILCISSSEIYL